MQCQALLSWLSIPHILRESERAFGVLEFDFSSSTLFASLVRQSTPYQNQNNMTAFRSFPEMYLQSHEKYMSCFFFCLYVYILTYDIILQNVY